MQIFTIGYEGITQQALIDALTQAQVRLLADVRAVPLSRRPAFSKNILAARLREAGIDHAGLNALDRPATSSDSCKDNVGAVIRMENTAFHGARACSALVARSFFTPSLTAQPRTRRIWPASINERQV